MSVECDLAIVGAGLAGMIAALAASDAAIASGILLRIILLEKQASIGGNSAKASSGMNAVLTEVQILKGVLDSIEGFYNDTVSSGDWANDPELVSVLAAESKDARDYLRKFDIELKKISQLGGHSFARTHRQEDVDDSHSMNVGYYIVSRLSKVIQERENIEIITNARVLKIEKSSGQISGLLYENSDQSAVKLKCSSVILTTGGYGSDYSENGFLQRYNSLAFSLPSTNGEFATGDGIRLGIDIGASAVQMDKVQIHPTSFIDPNNPSSKSKILAAESLRGHGGILLNHRGMRFVNELGRRDVVADAFFELSTNVQDRFAFLVLNEESKLAFGPGFQFYLFKGLFKHFENFKAFAEHYFIDYSVITDSIKNYTDVSRSGTDSFGKKVFPTIFRLDEVIYVARVTPSVHYTIGGLMFSPSGEILNSSKEAIHGLFGAGEVTSGVHGANRLGGNSLLECVVFGRRAGYNSFTYWKSQNVKSA